MLLVLSLWTSYYLQIKKIKTVHETLVSIFAGMAVGLVVRLAPGTMIKEMLVSSYSGNVRPGATAQEKGDNNLPPSPPFVILRT